MSTLIMESVCLHGDASKAQSIALSLSITHRSIKDKLVLCRYPIIPTHQVKYQLATYIGSYQCVKITLITLVLYCKQKNCIVTFFRVTQHYCTNSTNGMEGTRLTFNEFTMHNSSLSVFFYKCSSKHIYISHDPPCLMIFDHFL